MNIRQGFARLAILAILVFFAAPARAQVITPLSNISGTINPTNNLDNVYFIYAYKTGPLITDVAVGYQALGSMTAAIDNSYSFSSSVDPNTFLRYAIAAQYEVSGLATSPNVAVALTPSDNPTGQSWDTFFNTGAGSGNTQFNEPAVFAGLSAGDATLLNTFAAYTGPFHGIALNSTGNIWNFSNGSSGGTLSASVTPVPEPSTLALLALGVAGLAALRRKRGIALRHSGSPPRTVSFRW